MPKIKKNKEVEKNEEPKIFANPTGIPLTADNIKIVLSDQDKEKFYKSFLSDSLFEDEFSLFDNKVKVVFRSITVGENNDILMQVNKDALAGIASPSESYLTTILIYRFALSLVSITGIEFDNPNSITKDNYIAQKETPHKTYIAAKTDSFKDWNSFKLSAFLRTFLQFEKKLFLLEEAVNDQNFWKAAV
jgi:hypothetical protein